MIEKAEAREKERLKAEERKVNACMYFTAVISNIGMYGEVAWYPARRKRAWYTLMRFWLIKNGVAHAYDVYTA